MAVTILHNKSCKSTFKQHDNDSNSNSNYLHYYYYYYYCCFLAPPRWENYVIVFAFFTEEVNSIFFSVESSFNYQHIFFFNKISLWVIICSRIRVMKKGKESFFCFVLFCLHNKNRMHSRHQKLKRCEKNVLFTISLIQDGTKKNSYVFRDCLGLFDEKNPNLFVYLFVYLFISRTNWVKNIRVLKARVFYLFEYSKCH